MASHFHVECTLVATAEVWLVHSWTGDLTCPYAHCVLNPSPGRSGVRASPREESLQSVGAPTRHLPGHMCWRNRSKLTGRFNEGMIFRNMTEIEELTRLM